MFSPILDSNSIFHAQTGPSEPDWDPKLKYHIKLKSACNKKKSLAHPHFHGQQSYNQENEIKL